VIPLLAVYYQYSVIVLSVHLVHCFQSALKIHLLTPLLFFLSSSSSSYSSSSSFSSPLIAELVIICEKKDGTQTFLGV
jgi:hypothetical protein